MMDSIKQTEIFLEEFKNFSGKELKNEIDVFNLIETISKLEDATSGRFSFFFKILYWFI